MNNKHSNAIPSRNNNQPASAAPTNAFWKAYDRMLDHDPILAELILIENIFADVPAVEYRYLVAKFTGPWWQPFNCSARHGKLGTLACRGNSKAIAKIYEKGEATGIQIAHALIECSLDLKPNPAFDISASAKIALLQTYAMEAHVFCRSGHAFYPSLAWFNNRTKRAARFFNQQGKVRSGNASASEAKTTGAETQEASSVKWPDRLYDFNGVSTSLVYNGN